MNPGGQMERGVRRRAVAVLLTGVCAVLTLSGAALSQSSASQSGGPDLISGSAYLVAPANLIGGRYYESFPGTADFGLTIDGALALAATGDDSAALRAMVAFIQDGKDPSGNTVNDWTGIGTSNASGGAIGKEALLAEVVGDNPRRFGGHDLIAALDATVCTRRSAGCPAAGIYLNATSVFDQALGILAQLRAGQTSEAAAPVAYLESLQSVDGSFPSLIPPSGGPDVDSTAMAVMALALAPGARAAADVAAGVNWIASRQERNGGFPSAGAESINSTGLAIQALTLGTGTLGAGVYRTRIGAALAFLASQQNGDGGFNVDAGQPGPNLRASTQAVGGAVGTSFGTLRIELSSPAYCGATSDVILAVDFGHWGGPVLRSCDRTPTTGYAELNEGGWHTTGTLHDGPGFICRIGYNGYRHDTQYPTPAQQSCVQTPPASAYWAFWQAGPGQTSWTYSQYGAVSYHPVPGSVSLWVFGGTNLSGTAGSALPTISPQRLRTAAGSATGGPEIINAPPVSASLRVSQGSAWPTILAVVIAVLLAGAGAVVVRRRRRLEQRRFEQRRLDRA
jgi:hypothetical protein